MQRLSRRSSRAVRLRVVVGLLFVAAGLFHSLYYISGMLGIWESDLWNYLQVAAGAVFAGLGLWIIVWRNKKFTRKGFILLRLSQIAGCLGFLFVGIVVALLLSAGRPAAPVQTDYVVILGARVNGDVVSLSLRDRLEQGLAYLQQFPDTPVIVSGGQGPGEDVTEAEAMRRYLTARGVPDEQIIKEEASRNTYENLQFSSRALEERGENLREVSVTLITNDFHVYRAKLLANRVGLTVTALPAPTPPYTVPRAYTREVAALLKSWVVDR